MQPARAVLSLAARRRLPVVAAAAPALAARRWMPAAAAVTAPVAQLRFSTSESERVHGKLDADRVGSKAMRKKLAADAAEADRAKAPVAVPEPPAPQPWAQQQQQMAQWQQQQPPPQYGQPVPFGQLMKTYFLMGLGMSLAFIFVRLLLGF